MSPPKKKIQPASSGKEGRGGKVRIRRRMSREWGGGEIIANTQPVCG